jgi:hypothetical protein
MVAFAMVDVRLIVILEILVILATILNDVFLNLAQGIFKNRYSLKMQSMMFISVIIKNKTSLQ